MIEITLDGKAVEAPKGVRLLDWCREQGITIPTLCGENRDGPKTPCDLCVVEINGQLQRSCEVTLSTPITVISHSEAITERRQAALKRILSDHHADCEAPCRTACPADVDVQSYLFHIAQGDERKATQEVKKNLPMALSVGRVCPAFCESECRRTLVDEPLAIRQLKRHAADIDLCSGDPHMEPVKPKIGKKVAIIGAGPAGLAAGYFLTHDGVEVDLFDAAPEPGGWLRYGIPEYRLPKAILAKEIELMCRAGMKIHSNHRLGREIQLDQLKQDYDAVCLAIGAQKAVSMEYTGSDMKGVMLGVDYLRAYSGGKPMQVGKKVAVIGGGNTAIDCARTALRQGAEVTLIYRRTKAEMPAEDYEIHEAEVEGINFRLLSVPVENEADENGRVCRVKIERLELGEADASGRRRPEPTGEFEWVDFDTVIPAVSQKPDTDALGKAVPLTKWGTADANVDTFQTGEENMFAIGDFRLGPATAVEAIGEGRRCAEQMVQYLIEGKLTPKPDPFNSRKAQALKDVEARFYDEVPFKRRLRMPELVGAKRTNSFDEVEMGFDRAEAIAEAARCLACGCQKSQNCDLRDYATEYRISDEDLSVDHRQKHKVDESSPFIRFDPNRCISCGQCVVACREKGVHNVLNFPSGDSTKRVRIGDGELMSSSDCVQCGACVQACPVGAITEKNVHQHNSKPSFKEVNTVCTYCGVGCNITLHVDESKNRVAKVTGVEGSPVNEGMLCVKGRFGFDFINSKERLQTPLIRRDGKLVPVAWGEAIGFIASKFRDIKEKHGGNALAGFSSAKTTNEDNYLFQKFIRTVLGTNNVDHCARLCHATTVTGLEPAVGSGAMTNDIPSIQHSDLILITGSDTSNAHPIIASHIKQAVVKGNARVVILDPRKIDMAEFATLHVSQRPGTDVMLINAIMQEIIRQGWQDDAFIEARTEEYEAFKEEVMSWEYNLANASAVTGVPQEQIFELAKMIGTAKRTAIYYAMGITQHTTGTDNVRALANLQLLCGNLGMPGGGINPLRGQSNVQGACDMAALPNYLPGYQKLPNPEVTAKFEEYWDTKLPAEPGLKLTEIVDSMYDGDIKGLYVMGENPVLSDPDQSHVLAALDKLDILVVQDIFLTETAQLADVVLPAYAFAEKDGHFTNTERRVQRLRAAVKAPGQARKDWEILCDIARAMGVEWHYDHESEITDELCKVTPSYRGITWARTETQSLQWPCPTEDHPGTPIMHTESFTRKDKGTFGVVSFRAAAELPCEEYPLILTTGRQLSQFHTGTMTRKTPGMDTMGSPVVMISVLDAERLGLRNSQMVELSSRRGSIRVPVFITKRMPSGLVFLPFHFAEAAANVLTNPALDPEAKIPEFKVCAVKVKAA